jgi:P-type Mg2+ transporter
MNSVFDIATAGVFLVMGPFAHYFKLQALPPHYFVYLPVILLGYRVLTQAMKGICTRKYGWQ